MSSLNDGGPAFPLGIQRTSSGEVDRWWEQGMSLRDYFAGLAFQSIVLHRERSGRDTYTKQELAAEAYCYADAMLAARTPTKGGE